MIIFMKTFFMKKGIILKIEKLTPISKPADESCVVLAGFRIPGPVSCFQRVARYPEPLTEGETKEQEYTINLQRIKRNLQELELAIDSTAPIRILAAGLPNRT